MRIEVACPASAEPRALKRLCGVGLSRKSHCVGPIAAERVISTGQQRSEAMGFDQYHEPAGELSQKVRTFARMMASLIEEAEAINWYEQRISIEKDSTARAIMKNAQKEEFK